MGNAALLLGSNVGNRLGYIDSAIVHINDRAGIVYAQSGLYETAPWGITDQNSFINQAILLETDYEPVPLLNLLLEIEKQIGRERREKWGPRIIDIDILFFGQLVMNDDNLIIPHPFLQERRFSLVPINEIDPDWRHPILNKTVFEMLEDCPDNSEVTPYFDFFE